MQRFGKHLVMTSSKLWSWSHVPLTLPCHVLVVGCCRGRGCSSSSFCVPCDVSVPLLDIKHQGHSVPCKDFHSLCGPILRIVRILASCLVAARHLFDLATCRAVRMLLTVRLPLDLLHFDCPSQSNKNFPSISAPDNLR